jgi:hypothetical protein
VQQTVNVDIQDIKMATTQGKIIIFFENFATPPRPHHRKNPDSTAIRYRPVDRRAGADSKTLRVRLKTYVFEYSACCS